MSGTPEARWADGDRWRAVRLSYDGVLAADVILPDEGVAPSWLTAEELADATRELGAAGPDAGTVVMPSFDVAARVESARRPVADDAVDGAKIVRDRAVESLGLHQRQSLQKGCAAC